MNRADMSRVLTARTNRGNFPSRPRLAGNLSVRDAREEVIIFPVRNDSDDELAAAAALFCA